MQGNCDLHVFLEYQNLTYLKVNQSNHFKDHSQIFYELKETARWQSEWSQSRAWSQEDLCSILASDTSCMTVGKSRNLFNASVTVKWG